MRKLKEGTEVLIRATIVRQSQDTVKDKGYVVKTNRQSELYVRPTEIIQLMTLVPD